jgi:L-arabinonolactonase
MNAELVADCRNILGEGPIWSVETQELVWTDIEARLLFSYSGNKITSTALSGRAGSVAFCKGGGLLLAYEKRIIRFERSSGTEHLAVRIGNTNPDTRLNDGRCDRAGRFIVGEHDYKSAGGGYGYILEPQGSIRIFTEGISSANATCFSPDGRTMYFCDSLRMQIWAYDYDPETGTPDNRRVFHSLSPDAGYPDGAAVDSEGCLWNAEWGGSRIVRYTPGGVIDKVIPTPCTNPSSLAFGGSDLRTIFITSARNGLPESRIAGNPHEGGLFAVQTDVSGLPESLFG